MWTRSRRRLLLLAVVLIAPPLASFCRTTPGLSAPPRGETNPLRRAAVPVPGVDVSSVPAVNSTPGPVDPLTQTALPQAGDRALLPPPSPAGDPSAPRPASAPQALAPNETTPPPPTNAADEERPAVTRQWVEAQVQAVRSAQQLDETAKGEALKRYQAALDWLTTSEEALKKTAQYQAEIAGAAESVAGAKARLATAAGQPPDVSAPEMTLQEMEQLLSRTEAQLREAEAELARREEEFKRRGERKAELAKLTEDTSQRLAEARKQPAASPANGESAELALARRVELEAYATALEHQLERYRVEAQRHDALVEALPLQRDLAARERNLRQKQVAGLQRAVAARRKAESERQAREARRKAADSHPALRDLTERNAALAEENRKLAQLITETTDEVTAVDRTTAELQAEFESIQEKVRYAGNSSSIGLVLRKKRDELPDPRKCKERIRFVTQAMPDANLARIEFQEERTTLGDLNAAAGNAIAGLDRSLAAPGGQEYLMETVLEVLEQKRNLLDQLISGYDQYLTELSELEIGNRKLVAKVEEISGYVDERVLWVRSADMLGLGEVTAAVNGLSRFVRPSPWVELGKQCLLSALRWPGITALSFTVIAALIALQAVFRKRMRSLCVAASGSAKLRLRPTLEGLLMAAVMAARWPLLMTFAGWWLASANGAQDLGRALGWGFRYSALLLWVAEFTRYICKPGLLAESHFGWSSCSLAIARRHLRWLTHLVLPLVFVVLVAHHYHDGEWDNSMGRIAFIGAMLLLAMFLYAVFFARNNVLREILARQPDGWLARFRGVLLVVALGLPSALALLAAIGYYYSAQQLVFRLEITLAMVLGVVLLHAVASRWVLVKRRNLAIAQMQDRQSRESENAQNGPVVVPVDDTRRDLSAIHQQVRYLLGNAVAVCLLVGSWMIWADVLPALKVLDKKELWHSTVEVVEIHEDASGNPVRQRVPVDVPTTARHALMACLILMAAFVIGRRLPALLEITLLGRLPLDRGGRHAISVLLRYAAALIGVFMACRMMSITWVSVQWLAAGMTLGLGFGLQEIFANFISGLILLFERPIRVGDVITLGDTTGTVTNIRIRATTVTNWDRKELIVPNKELITGRLLNWTLTDPINRIVITVGIAYKSDTNKARELILAIAAEHPNVLDDPVPKVTFESFGDSTLNFVLRCYVASMDVRLDTIHELHEAIHDRFNEEGVEIAFPQHDLHVRSVDVKLNELGRAAGIRERSPSQPPDTDATSRKEPRQVA